MIVMTLVASILLYPPGGLDYVDALFFAAGSATQSGLNTCVPLDRKSRLDTDKLQPRYQQVVLVPTSMFAHRGRCIRSLG